MDIKNCKYKKNEFQTEVVAIDATINGQFWTVPLNPANSDYAEIMRLVDAGELTIEEAE